MKTWKVSALAWAVLTWGTAWAVPGLINYQGRLTDSSGNPIIGVVNVTFTFWDAEIGGTQLGAGFSDTDTVTTDADGIYSTEIGDDPGALIPASVFSVDSVWLNVNVGGEDLVPRLRMDSAGYAIHAGTADRATTATYASTAGQADTATMASNSEALQGLPASAFLNMSSDAYVVVKTTSDPVQNGSNLLAAYGEAKALTPNGAALSATNRAVVLIPPGSYDVGPGELRLDTEFVDVVGLSTAREDQYLYGQTNGAGTGVLAQTADDVRIENLTVKSVAETGLRSDNSSTPAAYYPNSDLPATVIRNCEFGDDGANHSWSMREGITYSGTYTDCASGEHSFGCYGTASGTFTDCSSGGDGFGFSDTASGTFTNCTGGDYSFGSNGTASGTFTNCTGGVYAFGGYAGTASGVFTGCTGGGNSFGGDGSTASGTFTNCTGDVFAFGGLFGTASGTFTDCTGGDYAFGGYNGTVSGVFTGCTGGSEAFGGSNGTSTGARLSGCRMTGGSWTGTWDGTMQDCQWAVGITLGVGGNARIYNSKFLGTVDLNGTTAGIANSYVRGISNTGSASFNFNNLADPSVN